jgi:hypothetical protein
LTWHSAAFEFEVAPVHREADEVVLEAVAAAVEAGLHEALQVDDAEARAVVVRVAHGAAPGRAVRQLAVQADPLLDVRADALVTVEAGLGHARAPAAVAPGAAVAVGELGETAVHLRQLARRRAARVDDRHAQHADERQGRDPDVGPAELHPAPVKKCAP